MTAPLETTSKDATQKTWKRRGLFAAVAALVGGVVAKMTEQRVDAGTDGDVVLGATNISSTATRVFCSTPDSTGLIGACTGGTFSLGIEGWGSQTGVFGHAIPLTPNPNSAGVLGLATEGAAGVRGFDGNYSGSIVGVGVLGESVHGLAVQGRIVSSSATNTIAIYGVNASSYTGSVPGTGGFGVVGVSQFGHGVLGATSAAGAGAVVGNAYGITGAYAAIFFGPAIVEGDFTVVGGAKSAAVPHPDGTHRRLYCLESPESWFEDFGKGQLDCGQADVTLDPDFAAMVNLDDYHVFLTQYGGHDDLSVCEQKPLGFRVEAKDATASGRFSWRVVAKRKDIASLRFEPVVVPPKPEMPTIPDAPATPTPPIIPRHH